MQCLEALAEKFFDLKLDKDKNDLSCLKRSLDKFCKTGKKEDAFSVYFCFCEIYKIFGTGYKTIGRLIELLSDHEYHSGELLTKHRDHYSHSVYVFALGLAIYANDKKFAQIYDGFYKTENGCSHFLKYWGVTSLFHDIGYPFQLAYEQIKAYTRELWGDDKNFCEGKDNPYVSYDNMNKLVNLQKSVEKRCGYVLPHKNVNALFACSLADRLNYDLGETYSALSRRFKKQSEYMDHAYFSALILFKQIVVSGVEITRDVLDALTAILLHNSLNRYGLKTARPHQPSEHPLAYLLVLCDELQNWDRTAFGLVSKKDPLAYKALFEISEGELKIEYVFNDLRVKIPVLHNESGNEVFTYTYRDNLNVLKLQGKKFVDFEKNDFTIKNCDTFVDEIYKLIKSHTQITALYKQCASDKKPESFASSDKFINLCDFAVAVHASYRTAVKRIYGIDEPPFEELMLELKLSNIEQAKSYAEKLELINCFYSDKELDYPVVECFVEKDEADGGARRDLGFLAREEHLRWVKEKLSAGWKYGTSYIAVDENGNRKEDKAKRNSEKIHKDIVPYDCLTESEKEKDKIMIKNMVPFLYKYGHGVRIYSYRHGRKPALEIAGCGHRNISMTDEDLRAQIKNILSEYAKDNRVTVRTNFAYGADQLIAECAAELGLTIKAVLPLPYEEYIAKIKRDSLDSGYKFDEADELKMRHLLALAVSCKVVEDDEYTYLKASEYIIGKCSKLIALWDGIPTKLEDEEGNPINQGGTYYNICLARNSRRLKDEDIHIINCKRKFI